MNLQNSLTPSNWFNPSTAYPNNQTDDDSSTSITSAIDSQLTNDSVNLSTRAQTLSKIHEEFFASGPISSERIQELSARLHEEGLLQADDVRRITGQEPPSNNPVSQSISFLNDYIQADPDQSDQAQLIQTLEVLNTVNEAPTPEKVELEKQSQAFINGHYESLKEANVSSNTLEEFENLVSVFSALERARVAQGMTEPEPNREEGAEN